LAENQRLKTRKQQLKVALRGFRLAQKQLSTENKRLSDTNQQLEARKQELKGELEGLNDAHHRLWSENKELRLVIDQTQVTHSWLSEQLERAMADLEGLRAELGEVTLAEVRSLVQDRASQRSEVERLEVKIKVLREERSVLDRVADQLTQRDADLNAALAEGDR
jgi:chromosome segregation ATPase